MKLLNTSTPTISDRALAIISQGKEHLIIKAIDEAKRSKNGIGESGGVIVKRIGV